MLIHHKQICSCKILMFWDFLVKNLVFRDPLPLPPPKRSFITVATGTILVLNFFKSYSWVQDRNPVIILWLTSVDDLFEFYGPFIINSIS